MNSFGALRMEATFSSPLWPDSTLPPNQADQLLSKLHIPFQEAAEAAGLPDSFLDLLPTFYLPLAHWVAEQRLAKKQLTLVLGVCGGQGSGKSTLTQFLSMVLERGFGLRTAGFSLDDLYLTRRYRTLLGKNQHPLLATRGVPGTHDVAMGLELLNRLSTLSQGESTYVPMFDKSVDDRAPLERWPTVSGPIDVVIFEGWCVGVPPQSESALSIPINQLEQMQDKQGHWRQYVNQQLAGPYSRLFARIHSLIMLKVPDLKAVQRWRTEQEEKLAERSERSDGVMNEAQISEFIMHFQRLTEHALTVLPEQADLCVHLNPAHAIDAITQPKEVSHR